MLVAAVLLLATTIRLAAFNRRRETGIMRLVGASNSMLQLPFMLEGVIAVALGAAVSVGGLWAIVHYFVEGFLATELPIFEYIEAGEVWVVAPILFAIGILLAGVSSVITLSRYLKV
jgi:cell division transport system permease protein